MGFRFSNNFPERLLGKGCWTLASRIKVWMLVWVLTIRERVQGPFSPCSVGTNRKERVRSGSAVNESTACSIGGYPVPVRIAAIRVRYECLVNMGLD